jgi:hypothetical protein
MEPVAKAKSNYTPAGRPPETPISISEAANRVLKFYPAGIARPLMEQGLANGRIRVCSYRELVGHHAPEPTPDNPAFWKPDPRGQTRLTPFPWPEDCARRRVQPRGCRRPLCDYTAIGLMVVWEDVAAMIPAAAMLAETGVASDAPQEAVPTVDRPSTTATPKKPKPKERKSYWNDPVDRVLRKRFPDNDANSYPPKTVEKEVLDALDPEIKESGRKPPSRGLIHRKTGRWKN